MTLLDPEERNLYTDALRPPPGMRFDAGVGTTYSLDLDTLLTVPLHLLLYSREEGEEELLESGVSLLRALRRVSERLTVYCERGRILEPGSSRELYGLLEEIAAPVPPPAENGSFHPKLWLLRFRDPEEGTRRLRLLVLSRNLTRDLSWDLMLRLEGEPATGPISENAPLVELLEELGAGTARGGGSPGEGPTLLEDLRRAEWELPEGFDRLRFHVTGPERGGWLPDDSDRLFAVTPFCRARALRRLAGTTRDARGLLSRPEELLDLDPDALDPFDAVYELDEMAERAAGAEAEGEGEAPTRGLHAKLYVAEDGDRTRLHLGSANATNAALLGGRNVEVMAELVGPTSAVGGIDEVLDPEEGLRPLLREWTPPDVPPEPDPERKKAERRLERARSRLAGADLRLRCREVDQSWRMELRSGEALDLEGVEALSVWPVTVDRERAADGGTLRDGGSVTLPGSGLRTLTTFVAFRLVDAETDQGVTFVLNLPVTGLPREERDAALVRGVIRDRESFLRYLLLLLGEMDEPAALGDGAGEWGGLLDGGRPDASDELPLLEELTRAYCRRPERLEEVRELVADLRELATGDDRKEPPAEVIPEEFMEVWATFEEALGSEGRKQP